MKNFLLILAYFLKYGGIVGASFFMLAFIILTNTPVMGNPDEGMQTLIFYAFVFVVMFFIGNFWSKKLLIK